MKRKILIVLIFLTLLFIWGQSALSVAESSANSHAVTSTVVQPIQQAVTGKATVTDTTVRKMAHVLEFSLLGFEMALLFVASWKRMFIALNLGLLAALIDETIQIFSGRGDQISDVWLDFSGVLVGVALGMLVVWLYKRKQVTV